MPNKMEEKFGKLLQEYEPLEMNFPSIRHLKQHYPQHELLLFEAVPYYYSEKDSLYH